MSKKVVNSKFMPRSMRASRLPTMACFPAHGVSFAVKAQQVFIKAPDVLYAAQEKKLVVGDQFAVRVGI